MNSRERIIATLNHIEPDKVPIYRKLLDYLGIKDKNIQFMRDL